MKNAVNTKNNSLAVKHSNPIQKHAGMGMMLGNLGIKQVMIADLGDGAFTDQSIKVKPDKSGNGLVLKCVQKERLLAGLALAGIDPRFVKITKGSKHWIAFVKAGSTGKALVKL